jgi:hypothetical protein
MSLDSEKSTWLNQFVDHPIISTVLWIMGSENKDAPVAATSNRAKRRNSGERNSISWKMDENGGDIMEFINGVQGLSLSNADNGASSAESTQLLPRSPKPLADGVETGVTNNENTADGSATSASTADATVGSVLPSPLGTPSPQWGHFVAITPEQQEKFESMRGSIAVVNKKYEEDMSK